MHNEINTLSPRQNVRHFADDIFKCIFLNENVLIPIKISLKSIPKGPINNIQSLVQIMVWRRPGAKPLSEPMMVSLLKHICVTRPQWVNITTETDLFLLLLHHRYCTVFGLSRFSDCHDSLTLRDLYVIPYFPEARMNTQYKSLKRHKCIVNATMRWLLLRNWLPFWCVVPWIGHLSLA